MEEQRKDNIRYVAFKYFEGDLLPEEEKVLFDFCLLYTSPSPRDTR